MFDCINGSSKLLTEACISSTFTCIAWFYVSVLFLSVQFAWEFLMILQLFESNFEFTHDKCFCYQQCCFQVMPINAVLTSPSILPWDNLNHERTWPDQTETNWIFKKKIFTTLHRKPFHTFFIQSSKICHESRRCGTHHTWISTCQHSCLTSHIWCWPAPSWPLSQTPSWWLLEIAAHICLDQLETVMVSREACCSRQSSCKWSVQVMNCNYSATASMRAPIHLRSRKKFRGSSSGGPYFRVVSRISKYLNWGTCNAKEFSRHDARAHSHVYKYVLGCACSFDAPVPHAVMRSRNFLRKNSWLRIRYPSIVHLQCAAGASTMH